MQDIRPPQGDDAPAGTTPRSAIDGVAAQIPLDAEANRRQRTIATWAWAAATLCLAAGAAAAAFSGRGPVTALLAGLAVCLTAQYAALRRENSKAQRTLDKALDDVRQCLYLADLRDAGAISPTEALRMLARIPRDREGNPR